MFSKNINFLKRFFEPAFGSNKKITYKMFVESSLGSFWFDILPLFTIPFIIKNLETKNYEQINVFIILFLILYIVMWVVGIFIRKWDISARYFYEKKIDSDYREKIILKDNTSLENMGTGKLQSIISKGVSAWSHSIWEILYQIPRIILSLASGVYILKAVGTSQLLIFFACIFISGYLYVFFKKKMLKYDLIVNDIDTIKNANSVRLIMSRQEIVFANKETSEVNNLIKLEEQKIIQSNKSAKFDYLADLSISSLGVLIPFLGLFYLIKYGNISSLDNAAIVSFLYFGSRVSYIMYNAMWIFRQIIDRYPQIKDFWKFIDETPELKNYNEGKAFVHGGGEIELRGVDFRYGK